MSEDVELSIRNAETGAVLLETTVLRLPVEIGRFGADNVGRIKAGDGRVVHFGEGFGTLSRQHLSISRSPDGGLMVTRQSSNAISQIGQEGTLPILIDKGGTARMAPGAMRFFETVGLHMTVCSPKAAQVDAIGQPLHLVYDSSSTGGLKALDLDGVSIALIANGPEVLMRRRPGAAAAALAAVREEGGHCLLMVGPDGAGGVAAISGVSGEVEHNRRMMDADETVDLAHLSTLEIRGQLLRIMSAEEGKGLSCTNTECRQLNPYLPGENCRYCGQRLGDGTSYWVHS